MGNIAHQLMDKTMKDPEKKSPAFDATTAKLFASDVAVSPHHAYRDAHGAVCLTCIRTSGAGGVAVNEDAIKWLREQQGAKFVRLINHTSKLDITFPLERFPNVAFRDGKYGRGRYCFVDADDFGGGPEYPPPTDYAESM